MFTKFWLAAVALAIAAPASAQLIARKDLSVDMALAIAQTAMQTCKAQGYKVSVSVIDRSGEILVHVRGDNSNPHTFENSFRKAYTARTTGAPSADLITRMGDPTQAPTARALSTLPHIIALAGALPIKVGDDVIGAIGVSGAPGGEKDEACAKAGIDKVADQLR
jgi:uncharacterized protein GlcG (DUF336 family)